MLKLIRLSRACSSSKPPNTQLQLETLMTYYKSGKSSIAISQHLISSPKEAFSNLYPNFYIHQQYCNKAENEQPNCVLKALDDKETTMGTIMKIFRIIVKTNLSNKDLGLDINSLKSNPCIMRMIQLKENKKFITQTSQIIIDDEVTEKPGTAIEPILAQSMKAIQNEFTAMGLPFSYMISKSNVLSPTYLKLIAKKKKAIHSDVIQCASPAAGQQKKNMSLEQIVYNHGFKLQHLFLRPYSRGCPTGELAANDSFNLQELIKVLNIIDFEGKIVLENSDKFYANVEYLDSVLRKCGYQRRKSGSIDLINQYMIM